MTPPIQDYSYETPIDISINKYRLIDSLKDKFLVLDIDNEDVNSFFFFFNDFNNVFINLLLDISNFINSFLPDINNISYFFFLFLITSPTFSKTV